MNLDRVITYLTDRIAPHEAYVWLEALEVEAEQADSPVERIGAGA